MKLKEVLMPALKLFFICVVSALLLAGTNALTKNKIAESSKKQEDEGKKIAFADAESFENADPVELASGKEVKVSVAKSGNGEIIGYVFTSASKGYGGDVTVMTGVDKNGTVKKTVILSMSDETPGLGQNAGKDEFLNQFADKSGKFTFTKNGGNGNEIQGVTSASFTSKAVIESVNDALDAFAALLKQEG